ncbi:aminoglycoside phosphotransferase family protein [Brevibacterium litoralis]|uniref:aminoglycoside phosphotransferase family protein n=1 Tax=Brevibacterium litoralis TaxID=3138935 RepID=UPI0032EB9C3F
MEIPRVLFNSVAEVNGEDRARAWEGALDFMYAELVDRWDLRPDPVPGSPWAGMESLVVPVLTREGYRAILRFASPNRDNPQVHHQVLRALRAWDGHGAVRVVEEDSSFRATLQERLRSGVDLSTRPLAEVPAIWGQLSRSLRVTGGDGFVRVQDIAARFVERLPERAALLRDFTEFRHSDARILDIARAWGEQLAASPERTLLHADLHYYNILAGNPGPDGLATWKAIDPQPLTGPPAYTVAPVLWNRLAEIPVRGPAAQAAWLRAFATDLCRHAEIDPQYGMGAAVVREVENMFWYLRAAGSARAAGDSTGAERSTGDAARSLWVVRALTGSDTHGTDAHRLKPLG